MSSNFVKSLLFTIALALVVFITSYSLPSSVLPSAPIAFVIGVLLAGLLVPFFMHYQPTADSAEVNSDQQIVPVGDSSTLYVGNLPYKANEEAVRGLFQQYGTVVNVRLMKDRQTGRRRGFGFVEVAAKDAQKIIQKLNDFEFEGRTLKVREAKERQENEESEE